MTVSQPPSSATAPHPAADRAEGGAAATAEPGAGASGAAAGPYSGARVDLALSPARLSVLRGQWPARRVLAAAVSFPLLLLLLTDAGGGWVGALAPGWTAALGVAALLGAGTVASYVPLRGSGTVVDTGCTSCAALAAASVVCAALTLANNAPHALSAALVAAGFTLLGLTQRVVGQASCATG